MTEELNNQWFFTRWQMPSLVKPPEFKMSKLETNRKLEYRYTGEIKDAFLLYTTDTSDWGCKNYQWNKITADISGLDATIVGILTDSALYCFINGITTYGLMFSSSIQKTKKP